MCVCVHGHEQMQVHVCVYMYVHVVTTYGRLFSPTIMPVSGTELSPSGFTC